ncbi:MAG: ankyrin repeat domain-containing protein [Caulobacteraceae bacterium]
MSRALTPKTTVDQLRKAAKRWLKALRAGDRAARARLKAAWPTAPADPVLRDVQHALAREFGLDSWIALKSALDDLALARKSLDEQAELVMRQGWDGDPAAARRVLQRRPELARYNLFTAAACGDLEEVQRRLAGDPQPATRTGPPLEWTALMHVTYGRLDDVNAVAVARALLDAGADPNAKFNDGWESPFKVLTGAIRLGEGARPSHPQALELVDLLIERGADPYDLQALYNISIVDADTGWYDLLWRRCEVHGRLDAWRVPGEGRLGGAKGMSTLDYLLGNAVGQNHLIRAEWLLERGADAGSRNFYMGQPQVLIARLSGFLEMADLLQRHGAQPAPLTGQQAFQAACMALDRTTAETLLAADPLLIEQPHTLLAAAEIGNEPAVELLLSLGARLDGLDPQGISPLHRAVQSCSVQTVRRMVEAGADPDLRERRWRGTPLSWAVVLKRPEAADYLATVGHDIRPLAVLGRLDRLKTVLEAQPWRAAETIDGTTALFCFPEDDEERAAEVARLLLAYGADPTAPNPKGQTPAEVARTLGFDDLAKVLEAAHAP